MSHCHSHHITRRGLLATVLLCASLVAHAAFADKPIKVVALWTSMHGY